MSKITYYHAGCPVCIEAERTVVTELSKATKVEVVHLGENKYALEEAKKIGLESVPALVIDGSVLHINFGAPLSALES